MAKIDSVFDFSDKALVELKSWLEPWFRTRDGCECVPAAPTGSTIDAIISGLSPAGWWKLNESSGHVAHDSSGNGLDLTVDAGLVDPLWGQPAGPPGTQTANFENGVLGSPGSHTGTNTRVSRSWAALTGDFTAGVFVSRNSAVSSLVLGQGNAARAGGSGWQLAISTGGVVSFDVVGVGSCSAINPLAASTWAMIAGVHSGTTFRLNMNGLDQSTLSTGSYSSSSTAFWIGHDLGLGGFDYLPAHFTGSYAFLIPSALTGAQLLSIYNSAVLPGAGAGKALLATGLGGTYWDYTSSAGSGVTAARPTVTTVGISYFDTTLGKPIWWNGTVWKDATGATV